MKMNCILDLTDHSEARLWFVFAARCNGHFQAGPGTAPGPGPHPSGEHRGPDWLGKSKAGSDLFSEMNPPEIQKLKQQLLTVGFPVFPFQIQAPPPRLKKRGKAVSAPENDKNEKNTLLILTL